MEYREVERRSTWLRQVFPVKDGPIARSRQLAFFTITIGLRVARALLRATRMLPTVELFNK